MKKILLVIVPSLLIFGLGYLVFFQKSQQSQKLAVEAQSSAARIEMATSTLRSFTDVKSGLSFEYPVEWSVAEDADAHVVCLGWNASSTCAIRINIAEAADERHEGEEAERSQGAVNNEARIHEFERNHSKGTFVSEQRIVNGLHMLIYSSASEIQAFIETPKFDYSFIVSNRDEHGKTRPGFENASSTINDLLSTVQIKK